MRVRERDFVHTNTKMCTGALLCVSGFFVVVCPVEIGCIDADVLLLADDVIAYNGYYSFKLTKDGTTNVVHAKFTYVYKKDASGDWKILIHNSGMTPKATETYPAKS